MKNKILTCTLGTMLIVLFAIAVIILNSPSVPSDTDTLLGGRSGGNLPDSIVAFDSASNSGKVIYDGAVFLDRIIIGIAEPGSYVSIIDTDTSVGGLPDLFFSIYGNDLIGSYEIGAQLDTGIWLVSSGTNNITIIYTP